MVRLSRAVSAFPACREFNSRGSGNEALAARLWCGRSRCRSGEISYPRQIESSRGEGEYPVHAITSAMSCLAERADGLEPAEYLFHPFALALTHQISGMPRRSAVDRAAPARVARGGDVRCHLAVATSSNEVGNVVAFVSPKRDAATVGQSVNQRERWFSLCVATRNRQRRLRHQPASLLHQDVAMISQMRSLAARLLDETGIRIRARGVGFVAAALATEVDRRVVPSARITAARIVFRAEAFLAGPGLDQRSVHGEMFVRDQFARLGNREDSVEKR